MYSPAPSASPIAPLAQRPTEVVSPLIWLLEENRMEFELMIATPMSMAALRIG